MMNGVINSLLMNQKKPPRLPVAVFFVPAPARLLTLLLLVSPLASADDYFNPAAIQAVNGSAPITDLSAFNIKGGQLEGAYNFDIYLNGQYIDNRDVQIKKVDGAFSPLLTKCLLIQYGVKANASKSFKQLDCNKPITDPGLYIEKAKVDYDYNRLRIAISIPQASIERQPSISPKDWDSGINAMFVNYSYNGSSSWNSQQSGANNNSFVNLRSGLNIGSWRLRNYSTYNHSDGSSGSSDSFNSLELYLQRDIPSLLSRLTLGDTYTNSDVFDSFSFQGAKLSSDDNMLPNRERGYAPIIKGFAQSNAQVIVRQNGNVIYRTPVPAGAFTLTDLYPTSSNGDLEITIIEADGSERKFIQGYSSIPVMRRQGQLKYSVSAGKLRSSGSDSQEPLFAQATAIYGIIDGTTLYGGVLASDNNYNSFSLGVGQLLGTIGALSLDGTYSSAKYNGENEQGQSYRLQYSKDIAATGTSLSLAGYRYSTADFYSFDEANSSNQDNFNVNNNFRRKDKLQLNISQNLADFGSLYAYAFQQGYWNDSKLDRSANIGYGSSIYGLSYSLNYGYSKDSTQSTANQVLSLSLSFPLDFGDSGGNTYSSGNFYNSGSAYASLSSSVNKEGNYTAQTSISGNLNDNKLSYSVQQGYDSNNQGISGGVSGQYKLDWGSLTAGYNYGNTSQQLNYGLSGGVVLSSYGIAFSQPLGDTMALVVAPKAEGVQVANYSGVYTDSQGLAVIPYINPYYQNRVELNTQTLNDNTDLLSNIKKVTLNKGAIGLVKFKTLIGKRVLFTLSHQGKVVPFGARVSLIDTEANPLTKGIVSDSGEVYLSGVPDSGQLTVKWGNNSRCTANFNIAQSNNSINLVPLECP